MTQFRLNTPVVACALLTATTGVDAAAVIVLDGSLVQSTTRQRVGSTTVPGAQFEEGFDNTGLGGFWSLGTTYDQGGFTADSSANANFTYSPTLPGLGGEFNTLAISGSTSAGGTATDATTYREQVARGAFQSIVNFTLDQGAPFAFTAHVQGSTTGDLAAAAYTSVTILDQTNFPPTQLYYEEFYAAGGSSFSGDFNINGFLPAGYYFIQISAIAQVVFEDGVTVASGTGTAEISMTNGLFTIPAPGSASALLLPCVLGFRRPARRNARRS